MRHIRTHKILFYSEFTIIKIWIPLQKPDLKKISAAEKDVIDKVLERFSDWSAKKISEYSHNDKPWKATQDNEYLDYELVFYRELPYSVREYEEDE